MPKRQPSHLITPCTVRLLCCLQPVMYTKASCLKASTYDAIIAVHSAPGNDQKRQMLHWLYADPSQTRPYRIKVFFFIGLVNDSLTQSKLLQEGQKFGDIVQGSFIDSYRNLTFKAVFVYSWLSEHCKGLKLLLRLDDDVFVDVHFFFKVWKSRVGNKPSTIMCDFVFNDLVRRHGKWFTSVAEIPETHYNFRHCMGYFAALTYDLVPKMAEVGRRTLFFWIDDVFVYGFLAKKLGADFVNVYRETSRGKSGRFEDCLKTQGPKCKLMVFVTHNIEKFPQFFSLTHNNTHLEQNIDKKKEGKSRPSKA
ncbi:hypothetical protein Btru_067021 [Bulinus truncatus]|nr:hypothetical protein Btru_067021 [Bulinus truncatus]